MNQDVMADLILGTYEHDLFKPFWLGNEQHSQIGYALLRTVNPHRPLRSVAILLHTNFAANLALLTADGEAGPQVLAAAPAIDRTASASYSLLGEGSSQAVGEADDMLTVSPQTSQEQPKLAYQQIEEFWGTSVQNVFSRLPVWSAALGQGRVFAPPNQQGGTYVATQFRPLYRNLNQGTPAKVAKNTMLHDVCSNFGTINEDQSNLLAAVYPQFAERTYPHANDTVLAYHTRFAANLYHLYLQNLPNSHPQRTAQLVADQEATAVESVLPLLSTYVCQIRLSGLETYFTNAVRLDDLQGAKLLADRIRYMLKRQLCTTFGLADQAEESAYDGTTIADLLCISESRFTLTYLVPAALAADTDALSALLYGCYQRAIQDVVTKPYPLAVQPEARAPQPLLAFLYSDVQRALRRAPRGKDVTLTPSESELREGLEVFLPTFAIAYVDGAPEGSKQLEEEYGKKLVAAYHQVQNDPGLMPATVGAQLAQMAALDETVALCTSTGAAKAWAELSNYVYGWHGHPQVAQLQEYFHDFRGSTVEEPEEISQIVAAMRGLAHGAAQESALDQMVRAEALPATAGQATAWRLHYQPSTTPQLSLPPLLQRAATLRTNDDLCDLNVAYVRVRSNLDSEQPEATTDPLIRFPSVTYAADRNSNVALISLRPTEAVYRDQLMPNHLVCAVDGSTESFALFGSNGQVLDDELRAYQDLYTYYFNLGDKGKDVGLRTELMKIPAHLARVLQRQATISAFFATLHLRLQAAGVRSLKLEDRFPVGRYLVPADQLVRALDVLDRSLCLDLLAVNGTDLGLDDVSAMTQPATYNVLAGSNGAPVDELHRFLTSYIPPILTGTTMLFKHKQALYLMLRAEERLQRQIQPAPVFSMGLIDMRGTLIDRGQIHGGYTFADWANVADTVRRVDRHSLDALAHDADWAQRWSTTVNGADEPLQKLVESRWTNRTQAADARRRKMPTDLANKKNKWLRDAAYYLVRAQHGDAG